MITLDNAKQTLSQPSLANCPYVFIVFIYELVVKQSEEEIQIIIEHWIRALSIKLGWIHDFNKLVAEYTTNFFIFEAFLASSKLLKTFTGHNGLVYSIDYSTFDGGQFIYSGSHDNTICVWDVETNSRIQVFNGHSEPVYSVKFSPYHYHNHRRHVICSSSSDQTIRFWYIKDNKQFQIFENNFGWVGDIEFSPFNGGRYLCSGYGNSKINLSDVETSKSLHVLNGHLGSILCVNFSPLQSNNNASNESNSIGIIGGNGYTICSGSLDKTIRIWDIETAKQLSVFEGHGSFVNSVKYGSNELINTILSGSADKSVRLWDIRSGQQIQVFNGHTNSINSVEYSPFLVKNKEIDISSNVLCSGSFDNTIRFWDARSDKNELHVIKGAVEKDDGIYALKFLQLKNKEKKSKSDNGGISLCYSSYNGLIHIWG
ncbi:G-protein beta WD-40 repeats containing protein [Reticulomyxa filosa]|uniref:G-protein beta WD-40 repeats containing protein n=1 Tax=Reticulomyxa filosa TaxID=46433 RepID=X6LU22_RETFI|nr:G-protein beta WD-40 repeats containing protein [Reticulomyxa filosa]|eukprot:ETO04230.1 G-protein beta WD-40 repeats containing protein [Reticulomyxa filosa]